jgi:hypothetical protein
MLTAFVKRRKGSSLFVYLIFGVEFGRGIKRIVEKNSAPNADSEESALSAEKFLSIANSD